MADIRRLTRLSGKPGSTPLKGRRREFVFRPIGIVHSPYTHPEDIPRDMNRKEGAFDGVFGELEISPEFADGLDGIESGSSIVVLFAFHEAGDVHLRVTPPGETRSRGVFASRSPHRPNPVGMTVVRVVSKEGNSVRVSGVDMIEGTPILDIKPVRL
jgi:tRNA (adenine37-N6)-methyltransferase